MRTWPRLPRETQARVGAAIAHLESHLADEVDLDEAARASGYSRTHFMRLFRTAAGCSVATYVRRRRISRAAQDLIAGCSIVETAVRWGYGSQAAFTRAFSRELGVSPAAHVRRARTGAPPVETQPRLELERPPGNGSDPEPVRKEIPPFRVVGLRTRLGSRRFSAFREVPALWEDWYARERFRALDAGPWTPTHGLSRPLGKGEIEYVIGIPAGPEVKVPSGFCAVDVPGGHYAVLAAQGDPRTTIQRLILGAHARWFLDPQRHRRGGWLVEAFRIEPGASMPTCEFWIPLRA